MKIKNSRQYSVISKQERIKNLSTVCCLRSANQKGVTLIELVITMVLMGIVALVVANALSTGIMGNLVTDNRKEGLDQARVAMERMAKEIRNTRSLIDVGTATASEFCFINTEGTRIDFRYETPDIRRLEAGGACPGGAGTGDILSTNITAFKFTNPDGSDLTLAALTTNKRVIITLTSTISGENVTLQTEVWPRNL